MSVLKVAVASIIALSLVLGLALPALAGADKPVPWTEDFQIRIVKGMVTEVDEENQAYFKVQSGEDEIGIRVDENTRYFLLNVKRPVTDLLQQFRIRNQEQVGAAGEQALRLRVQNQAEVNAQDEPVNGLKKRVRAAVSVSNQARLRVKNHIALAEEVPIPETYPEIIRDITQADDIKPGPKEFPLQIKTVTEALQRLFKSLYGKRPVSRQQGIADHALPPSR